MRRTRQTEPDKSFDFSRLATGLRNITDPDRPQQTHGTRLDSNARIAEDTFHRARGISQVLSQAPADLI